MLLLLFSRLVMSNSPRPHELQHARPPRPSPTPRVHSGSHPSSQWCHPAISSLVVPFSSCPHPSQHHSLFQWVNSSHEVAQVLELQLLASFLSKKSQGWSPSEWTGWIQGTLKNLLQHHSSKASILRCSAFFTVQLSHLYRMTETTIVLTLQTFASEVMSLHFNTLSGFVIALLPRSKNLLISWLLPLSKVTETGPQKDTSWRLGVVSLAGHTPIIWPELCSCLAAQTLYFASLSHVA